MLFMKYVDKYDRIFRYLCENRSSKWSSQLPLQRPVYPILKWIRENRPSENWTFYRVIDFLLLRKWCWLTSLTFPSMILFLRVISDRSFSNLMLGLIMNWVFAFWIGNNWWQFDWHLSWIRDDFLMFDLPFCALLVVHLITFKNCPEPS